ncbi:MAG: hypothetical protein RSD49_20670 [Hafnia sp.]
MVEPFTGADLCKHRIAEHRDGGLRFYTIRPFTAPVRWPESAPLPESFRYTLPANDQHLLSYGLRPALPKALLPRDRKTAPEPVRHFNRAERESDARNLFDLPQRNQLRQPVTGF